MALEAVKNGHIKILIFLHENGVSIDDENIIKESALRGHLDCLIYACENDCFLNAEIFEILDPETETAKYLIDKYQMEI
jgi:hypothetical protein